MELITALYFHLHTPYSFREINFSKARVGHHLNPFIATLYRVTDMCMSVLPDQPYLDAQWYLPKTQCKEADSPSSLGQDFTHSHEYKEAPRIHPGLILEVLP